MYAAPRQPPYAPHPYPYAPTSTISLDEEVKLPTAPAERDVVDSLAEIYSIIVTLDALEKAFNKDSIGDSEYTEVCLRLLRQYRSNLSDARIAAEFEGLEEFKARWGIQCPRATERLKIGLPATQTHASGGAPSSLNTTSAGHNGMLGTPQPHSQSTPLPQASGGASTQSAILATENFITFLDALKLGMSSKDQLHPLLSEVITSVHKATETDFEGRANIIKWLIKLNGMKAHQELEEDDKREIDFEVDGAYRGFKAVML